MKKLLIISALVLLGGTALYAQGGSFEFEGRNRHYEVYLPQNFTPNMPLVVSIHGYFEDIEWYKTYTLLHEIADTAGFITVYPEAPWPGWSTGVDDPVNTELNSIPDRNDVGFISALIDTLKQRYDVDMSRVYCCGFSGGGHMTHKLVGELGHRFAAVATVAGHIHDSLATTLKPKRPFPILTIHGTLDNTVKWEGGIGTNWSIEQMLDFWIGNNGCTSNPDTVDLPDLDPGDGCTVQKISYTDCSAEGQVILYKVLDGGHSWPGSTTVFGSEGNKNMDINAGIEILNFFKQYVNPMADMAFIQTIEVPPLCYEFTGDSVVIGAQLHNPSNHQTEVFAYVRGKKSDTPDTLQLYDDGQHGDGISGDHIWGARWLPPLIDEMYEINLTCEDQTYGIIQDYFRKDTFSIQSDVPDITVRVEDFHSGKPLHGSEVFHAGNVYLTDVNGEIHIQECGGGFTFVVDFDKYGQVDRKFEVHSDTTFVITLVRDSYIKVMDRLTGEPVNGAGVYYRNAGSSTNDEGIATIRDYRKEQLIYRVEYALYFTQEDSTVLVPGDTLLVYLTRLVANIDFHITDEAGPVSNQAVMMIGMSKKTGSDGIVRYPYVPARQVYHYSVERDCYLPVLDSVILEIDTTVLVVLEPDAEVPELHVDIIGDTLLQVSCSKSGMIYVVPAGTEKHLDSIQTAQLLSFPIVADQLLEIPATGLPESDYSVYAIDGCLNISTPFTTDVADNVTRVFRIYPNPAHDRIIVEVDASSECTLVISSINGQTMHQSVFLGPSQEIDLSSLTRGVYFITARSIDFVRTEKIIKQ